METYLRRTAMWYGGLGLLAGVVLRNLALPPAYARHVVAEMEVMGIRSLGVALTAAVAALAFVSFTRKVATFRTAGFESARAGDALVVRSVEPGSSAAAARPRPREQVHRAPRPTAAPNHRAQKDLAPPPHATR